MIRPARKSKNDLALERLAREWNTVSTMVGIYCRDHHRERAAREGMVEMGRGKMETHGRDARATTLCAECKAFLAYANTRLERCRFGLEKPTCAKCPVHCYQRDRREQVRVIMRYAGPRMVWEHPIMSLRHWLDGLRPAPQI
jgi:hypothetical protein